MKFSRSTAIKAVVGVLMLAAGGVASVAHAGGNVAWSIGAVGPGVSVAATNAPYYGYSPYVAPAPVYVAPPVVYAAPVVVPAPVYYGAPVVGARYYYGYGPTYYGHGHRHGHGHGHGNGHGKHWR